jgi:uncharacterized protein YggE
MPISRFPVSSACFFLLLGFVTADPVKALAQEVSLKASVPSITITGMARAEVVPDIATISLGIVTERANAPDAASENARAAQAVVDGIKAQGIEAKDIRTQSVTLTPVYDEVRDGNGRVTKHILRGYSARNDLSVRVRQIDKAGALAQQLINKGANQFGGIIFDYEGRKEKLDVLRGDAMRDALSKANIYTNALGLRLGRVLEISPPAAYPIPRAAKMAGTAQEAAASAAIPLEPGVEILQTEVQVTWEVAQ